jgi:hypothetical protein
MKFNLLIIVFFISNISFAQHAKKKTIRLAEKNIEKWLKRNERRLLKKVTSDLY